MNDKTTAPELERETSMEERMTWGDCPVCHARHGEYCAAEIGIHIGRKVGGSLMETGEGVHVGRLTKAPKRIRIVAA